MTDIAELALKIDSSQARTATKDLDKFGKEGRSAEGAATRLGKSSKLAFAGMAAAATAAVGAVASLGAATRQALEFGSALSEVGTLIEGTAKQTAFLDDASKRLAATYGGSATAQANAFYQAISAGAASVEDAAVLLDVANRLAIGGVTDVTTAVDVLTSAMDVYKESNLSAADASDALFVAMKGGKTTIEELSASIGKALPFAQKLGLSFDETAAAVAALTRGGLSTAESVTGLKAALIAIANPSQQARDLAKGLSLEFNAAGLQGKNFAEFMGEVSLATGGSVEQMSLLFSSSEAAGAALAFSGQTGKIYTTIMENMGIKVGETDKAFNKMSEDMQQRLNVAMAGLNNIGLTIGDMLLTVLVPAIEGAAKVVALLADNADALAISLGILAVRSIPAAISGLTTLSVSLFGGATAAGAMALAMNAIPLVAVVTGLTLLYRKYQDIGDTTGVAAAVTDVMKESVDGLNTALDTYATDKSVATKAAVLGAARDMEALAETTLATVEANLLFLKTQADGNALFAETANQPGGIMYDVAAQVDAARASLEKARETIQNLTDDADGMGGSLDDAEDSAGGVARASGLINFDGAASSAADLAKWLGISLSRALALSATTPAMADEDLAMSQPVILTSEGRAAQREAVKNFKALQSALDDAGSSGSSAGSAIAKGMKEAEREAAKLADEIERLEFDADPIKRYNAELSNLNDLLGMEDGLSQGAYDVALQKLNDGLADQIPMVNDVASAWGDFIAGGLRDFKGFANSILDSFTSLLSQMIATAARNKILISLGASGSVAGGAASAATGGGGGIGGLGGIAGGFGAALTAGGSLMGVSGLLGGLGAGVGMAGSALVSGGLSSMAGVIGAQTAAATAAGASMASIGAAIGAVALPVAAVAAAVFAISKGFERKFYGSGLRGSFTDEGADVETLDFFKGGAFRSNKTVMSPLEAEQQAALDSAATGISGSVRAFSEQLGLSSAAIDGFVGDSFTIWSSRQSAEETEAQLTAELEKLAVGMSDLVLTTGEFTRAGETSFQTLERLSGSLIGVNTALNLIDGTALQASLSGADAASRLVDLAGGLEAFGAKTGFVFANMMTTIEQRSKAVELATLNLETAFGGLTLAIPETHAEFMALVKAQDLTTAAGRNAYAALLDVAGAFVLINGTAQQVAETSQRLVDQALTTATTDLNAAFAREMAATRDTFQSAIDGLQDSLTGARERLADSRAIASALEGALESRLFPSIDAQRQSQDRAAAYLQSLVGMGRINDVDALQNALSIVADPSSDTYETLEDYRRDFGITSGVIAALEKTAGFALTADEQAVNLLEQQIDNMRSQSEMQVGLLQQQLDGLLGIDESIMSLAAAMSEFRAASAAAGGAGSAAARSMVGYNGGDLSGSFTGNSLIDSNTRAITEAYGDILGRVPDAKGLAFWKNAADTISIPDIRAMIAGSAESITGVIPQLANGGAHAGGWRIVGERGPELEYTGPSQIASNSKSLFDTSRLEAQVERLTAQVSELKQVNMSTARSNVRSYDILEKWDNIGTPGTAAGEVVKTEAA